MKGIHRFFPVLSLTFLFTLCGGSSVEGAWSGKLAQMQASPPGLPRPPASQQDPARLRETLTEGVAALQKGNPLMAWLLLDGLDEHYPVVGDYILYYRIQAIAETDDHTVALSYVTYFLQRYPDSVLVPRVRVEGVKARVALGLFSAAREEAETLLAEEVPNGLKRELTLLAGLTHEREESWKAAQELYQRLAYSEPTSPEGEEAEQRSLRIARESGVSAGVPDASLFLSKVKALNRGLRFGQMIEACEDLEKVQPKGETTDEARLLKARGLIKKGRAEAGVRLYKQLMRKGASHGIRAEAAYRLGSHYWNGHGNALAKREFKRLVRKYPRSSWSLHAHYALGRIHESDEDAGRAREHYLKVGKLNPGHDLAVKGAWRIGWVEYRAGRYEKALKAFDHCLKRYRNADIYSDALYWKGRSAERLKRTEQAERIFRELANDFSWSFYGVMARKRLEASGRTLAASEETGEVVLPCGSDGIAVKNGTPMAYHLPRAEELIEIGFYGEAREEVDALRRDASGNPEVECYVGELYEKSRSFYDSVRWMYRVGLNNGLAKGEGSHFLNRYLYPLAFWDTVRDESGRNDVDPYLVLAVMRQESLFQDDVVSFADARGLMQIIPPTGRSIARQLGVSDFNPEMLFDPKQNIAFGVWYLKQLMKRSEGDLVRVLASYNAGESRSDMWWNRHKHLEMDERIESITFRETRGYVKKVLRNLENYRRLYPGTGHSDDSSAMVSGVGVGGGGADR